MHERSVYISDMSGVENSQQQLAEQMSCDELCHIHYGRILQLCRLLLVNHPEAEEVAQEVFLKLVQEYQRSVQIRSWEAWLVRVAVNACHDRRRSVWWKWWRTLSDSIQQEDLPSPSRTPEEYLLTREEREQVWNALHALSARQREVFVLRRIEGWSTEEVAATLGLTAGSIKRHLFHALRHLEKARRGQT